VPTEQLLGCVDHGSPPCAPLSGQTRFQSVRGTWRKDFALRSLLQVQRMLYCCRSFSPSWQPEVRPTTVHFSAFDGSRAGEQNANTNRKQYLLHRGAPAPNSCIYKPVVHCQFTVRRHVFFCCNRTQVRSMLTLVNCYVATCCKIVLLFGGRVRIVPVRCEPVVENQACTLVCLSILCVIVS
jgi:hypothetical protein